MRGRSVVGLVLLMTSAASAVSFFEGVGLKNELDSTVAFELRQYWLLDDEVTRPAAWTEKHLARTVEGELLPAEEEVIAFEGGGWVAWEIRDYGTGRLRCDGEFDFATDRAHAISIELGRCGNIR
jgi:hypothetical protein